MSRRRPAKQAEVLLSVPPEAVRKLCCLIHCLHSRGKTLQKPASLAGRKGISRSLHFAQVKWASLHVSLSHEEEAALFQAPGTGISLPTLSALPWFPTAPPMCLPGSRSSLPLGASWLLGMPALRLHGQGQSLSSRKAACREHSESALQWEEEARMRGTGAGRNTQWHDWGPELSGGRIGGSGTATPHASGTGRGQAPQQQGQQGQEGVRAHGFLRIRALPPRRGGKRSPRTASGLDPPPCLLPPAHPSAPQHHLLGKTSAHS